MDNKKSNAVLRPIELDALYKERRYEQLLMLSRAVCILSIVVNAFFVCGRVAGIIVKYMNNTLTLGEVFLAVLVIILHIVIVVYGVQSIRLLKYKC